MKTALGRDHQVSSIILTSLSMFRISITYISDTLQIPVAYQAEMTVYFRIICNTVCETKFCHSS